MLFNSVDFLVFFPIAVLGYFLIPQRVRYIWLLACSYYFYMCWNVKYVLLLLASTGITYGSGILLARIRDRASDARRAKTRMKWVVFLSFALNLGILGYFKYFDFFLTNIAALLSGVGIRLALPKTDVLLPVGISFYTFQALSYSADVYRGKIAMERNFLKYALFVSFFPQLVAGPIERSENLLGQFDEAHRFDYDGARDGLLLMLWGFFLKLVLADRIAIVVDRVFANTDAYGGWYLIVASALFAIQIYADFSGYSIIALGAAKVMSFRLTDNFDAPYLSASTAEFWQRWHITLQRWLRDYVYIPLGGSRVGTLRKYRNVMIVFLISGLWHGASWAFVIWGGLNGMYQIAGDLLKPHRERLARWLRIDRASLSHRLLRTALTFALIDVSWVFFRSGDALSAFENLRSMFFAKNVWILFDGSLLKLGLDGPNFMVMLAAIALLLTADCLKYKGIAVLTVILRQALWFRYAVIIASVLAVLLFGIWGAGYDKASFLYFQF